MAINKLQWLLVFTLCLVEFAIPIGGFAHHSRAAIYQNAPMQERILLMRHAEKPDDDGNPDLAPAGFARAEKLPAFILQRYGRPDFIFASTNSKHSSRPYETALPLSTASGVPVDTSFKDKDFGDLANALLSDDRFAGKFIVIFWHHGTIPDFAQALQARSGDFPDKWKSDVYNEALEFDYTGKHHPAVNRVVEDF